MCFEKPCGNFHVGFQPFLLGLARVGNSLSNKFSAPYSSIANFAKIEGNHGILTHCGFSEFPSIKWRFSEIFIG
jgi:hypothetical protein